VIAAHPIDKVRILGRADAMDFQELEDPKEVEAAQRDLEKVLTRELRHRENRIVGYPSGYFQDEVLFARGSGDEVFWWNGGKSTKGNELLNFFGRGTPRARDTLLIDLQFNFPKGSYDRRHGGTFIREFQSGRIALAHRGIVTRGKSRVPRDWLLDEIDIKSEQVTNSTTQGTSEVLPVGFIDEADIVTRIAEFCAEIRRAAAAVMRDHQAKGTGSRTATVGPKGELSGTLSEYFQEFVGTVNYHVRGGPRSTRFMHGAVVRALKDRLGSAFEYRKSSRIDLVVLRSPRCYVCEVKTSADWQSLYTAVGQLFVHAATLRKIYPDMKVAKVLVAPVNPSASAKRRLFADLGCHIVSFQEEANLYRMNGVEVFR
jgi:hypothetical protein